MFTAASFHDSKSLSEGEQLLPSDCSMLSIYKNDHLFSSRLCHDDNVYGMLPRRKNSKTIVSSFVETELQIEESETSLPPKHGIRDAPLIKVAPYHLFDLSMERVIWFRTIYGRYSCSQTNIEATQSPIVFSERFYRGVVKPQVLPLHMRGRNSYMGYRVTEDRILLLDVYNAKGGLGKQRKQEWATCRSLCIVATLSANVKPYSLPGLHSGAVESVNRLSSSSPQSKDAHSDCESSASSSPQANSRKKGERQTQLCTSRRKKAKSKSDSSNISAKSAGRVKWFSKGRNHYNFSQTNLRSTQSSTVFSHRCYYGMVKLLEYRFHMSGNSSFMNYRITQDKILLLDCYYKKGLVGQELGKELATSNISEATLEIGEFLKEYPQSSNGLVVALKTNGQLLVASYGKPPLGAILLRPKGDWLKFIDRQSDDTVKVVSVQNDDIVIIGPLDIISQLELGFLQLSASSSPEELAKKIYGSVNNNSLCIVATISVSPGLQTTTKVMVSSSSNSPGGLAGQVIRVPQVTLPPITNPVPSVRVPPPTKPTALQIGPPTTLMGKFLRPCRNTPHQYYKAQSRLEVLPELESDSGSESEKQ
ncbi:hypothetical protein PSACC_01736 [Paramicrosporidium saccamoebae]|uniref:Uncharacterized protein n=1 Tax=Paramicrosporidium saccamoebae TaxID=1246581 RepID=A0A2H9TL58_9FUNG|nr:hypothetical protein PSACC_01736 [Paramicrosporidium saccamoebae]